MTILWQNGKGSPKRVGNNDWAKDEDFTEIVAQINRRRLLTYRAADGGLDDPFDPAVPLRYTTLGATAPTQGKGRLFVEYIQNGRADFGQR